MHVRHPFDDVAALAALELERWTAVRAQIRAGELVNETPPAPTPPAPPAPPTPTPPAPAPPPTPTPPAPTPTPPTPPTPPAPAGDWTPPSKDDYEKLVAANAEAQKKVRQLEKAGKTEEEQNAEAAQRLDKIGNTLKATAVKAAVAEVAQRLRFTYPDTASSLIDLTGIEATLDLDGDEPKADVDQAVKTLIEQRLTEAASKYPAYVGAPPQRQMPGAGNQGNNADQGGNAAMNAAIRKAAGRG